MSSNRRPPNTKAGNRRYVRALVCKRGWKQEIETAAALILWEAINDV